jgi:peptide/nickel transport system permease protein
LLPRLSPIDPKTLLAENPRIPPAIQQQIIESFGLTKPLTEQYKLYFMNLFRGNLGYSFIYRDLVTNVLLARLPWTILLLGTSTTIFIIFGIILGVLQASKYGSRFDICALVTSMIVSSFPVFWLAMFSIYLFTFMIPIFPGFGAITSGKTFDNPLEMAADIVHHLILPASIIVIVNVPRYSFYLRNIMSDILSEDYIITARAKGLKKRKILFKHGLRNAMLPATTMIAMDFGFMIAGAVFVETVFSYPGIGYLAYESIISADYPLMNGIFIFLSLTVLIANFIAEALYSVLDPRIRRGA